MGGMFDPHDDHPDPKDTLQHYLQQARDALVWKLEGLGERDLRLPRTPTGTNLLGILRHCANVEIGYFGPTFGRTWPDPDAPALVDAAAYDTDPQADWWVPADTSAAAVVAFYRDVWDFSDATIADLPLDAPGAVPWWSEEGRHVTLHQVMVHVLADTMRHAGHADVLREGIDGAAGMRADVDNLPGGLDWGAYVARLRAVAETFPAS
jgi:uncharacterized damage-inducible protein DinB